MATYYARLAGNINASNVWATTPSGTAAAVTFASGDVLFSNSFAIAINVDTNLGGAGQVRNDTLGGATAGGGFTLNAGVTLTANCFAGSAATACVTFASTTPSAAFIVGNCTGGSLSGARGAVNSSSGTLTITGNLLGGSVSVQANGAGNTSTGTLNVTGNVTGGTLGEGVLGYAIQNVGGGTVNVIGNCLGGSSAAIGNQSTGTVNIVGQSIGSATGGAGAGVANISTGTIVVTRAVGNGYGPGSVGLAAAVGVANSALGVVSVEEIEYGTLGMSPTSGAGIRLKKITSNVAKFNYCDTAGAKTLVDATQGQMPAASDVRNGVSYASGALTGSAFIPLASSVASGVPVDASVGSAVLTAAAIRTELAVELARIDAAVSSRLAPSGTHATVTTLTNAPTDPTASAIASQVRAELGTELGRIDADISSRLASSAYSAAPTTAQIATAVEGSLLNEADGQQVLNAIVGAIGNTNLSEVSLVAAVRADLERVGGKIDSIPTTAAPTAAANATAVWSAATKEITGGTVTTLTNSPSVPSAASIASATRTELAVELARVDVATSTRLAGSAYTAPANSDITAIKAKTDLLNPDRLANVATTAIVGNLIAQANS